jgi:hypothetical protein
MKCYECGEPIRNESQRVMESVRMFKWSDTFVPFHKKCWKKRQISEARRHYAKTFVESLILLAIALIATYIII